jgi:hypothetical protein
MRVAALSVSLLALPLISASLATDAFSWANSLVSSDNGEAQQSKGGKMHTMDSWSYVDCGLASDVV